MSYRTTAVLVVILAIFGAYMYFFGSPAKPPEVDNSDLDVLKLDTGSIRSLEVRQGGTMVLIGRNPQGGWDQIKPEPLEGDQPRIVDVVGNLATLQATRVLTEVGDLAAFGLAKPEMEVVIGVGSADFVELLVGSENPTGTGSYVRRADGDKVYLVYSYYVDQLKALITEPPKARPTPTPFPTLVPTPTPGS